MSYQLNKVVVSRILSRIVCNVSCLIQISSYMSVYIQHALDMRVIPFEGAVFLIETLG